LDNALSRSENLLVPPVKVAPAILRSQSQDRLELTTSATQTLACASGWNAGLRPTQTQNELRGTTTKLSKIDHSAKRNAPANATRKWRCPESTASHRVTHFSGRFQPVNRPEGK
jgi:hypothetical protein